MTWDGLSGDALDEMMGIDDVMGENDVMGARRAFATRFAPSRGALPPASPRQMARAMALPAVPGTQAHGGRRLPLPFTQITFTNLSGTALSATARVQKPFRPSRLLVQAFRTPATLTQALTIRTIFDGIDPQQAGFGDMPVEGFQATVFDALTDFSPIVPGIDAQIDYRIAGAALGALETIVVSTMMFGFSMA